MNTTILLVFAIAYAVVFYAITWKRPHLALLFILALSPLQNDISGGGGVRFSIADVNLILAVPLLLFKKRKLMFGPAIVPILLYLAVCLYSFFASPQPAALSSMMQMVLYFIVAVVVFAGLARSADDYYPALYALVVTGVIFAIAGAATNYRFLGHNKNGIGASLSICLLVCAELWFREKNARRKMLLASAMAIITGGLLFSLSRGSWLGAILGFLVLNLLRRQFVLMLRVACVLVPLVAIAWTYIPQEKQAYALDVTSTSRWNIKLRYRSLDIARGYYEESPWTGSGVGLRKSYDATNIAWVTLAETGVLGFVTFFAIQIVLLWKIWKAHRKVRRADPLFSLLALGGALVFSRMGHGMVDHYWSRGAITPAWASVGMATFALAQLRRRRKVARSERLRREIEEHQRWRSAVRIASGTPGQPAYAPVAIAPNGNGASTLQAFNSPASGVTPFPESSPPAAS